MGRPDGVAAFTQQHTIGPFLDKLGQMKNAPQSRVKPVRWGPFLSGAFGANQARGKSYRKCYIGTAKRLLGLAGAASIWYDDINLINPVALLQTF